MENGHTADRRCDEAREKGVKRGYNARSSLQPSPMASSHANEIQIRPLWADRNRNASSFESREQANLSSSVVEIFSTSIMWISRVNLVSSSICVTDSHPERTCRKSKVRDSVPSSKRSDGVVNETNWLKGRSLFWIVMRETCSGVVAYSVFKLLLSMRLGCEGELGGVRGSAVDWKEPSIGYLCTDRDRDSSEHMEAWGKGVAETPEDDQDASGSKTLSLG